MDVEFKISSEPYPGLRAFRKEESDIFFGRDDHIDEMIVKLAARHFLCVTGPSGCGKSSLARTGLMNNLEAGFMRGRGSNWIFCDVNPGDQPINNLFSRLAASVAAEMEPDHGAPNTDRREQVRQLLFHDIILERTTSDLNKVLDAVASTRGRPIMILVDQFEELFRYRQSESDAATNYVEILLQTAAAARDIYIVITIRTDELEKCARYSGLTRLINQSQFLTPTLDRYQIQEAIDGPIRLWGGSIEPIFTTWLLNSLEEELDKLPLMQHALKLLYAAKSDSEKRRDVTIGAADFIRVFGLDETLDLGSPEGRLALRRSLSDRLTARYDTLPDRLKPGAQRVFCALTAVESQNRDIRRPRKLGALREIIGESLEDTRAIVACFRAEPESYLRCPPTLAEGDTVDVTHECILRLWAPLQTDWLVNEKRSADNIVMLGRLARRLGGEHRRNLTRSVAHLRSGRAQGDDIRAICKRWYTRVKPNAAWSERYLAQVDWADRSQPRRRLSPAEIFDRSGFCLPNLSGSAGSIGGRLRWSLQRLLGGVPGSWSEKFNHEQQQARMNLKYAVLERNVVTGRTDQLADQISQAAIPQAETRVPNLITR